MSIKNLYFSIMKRIYYVLLLLLCGTIMGIESLAIMGTRLVLKHHHTTRVLDYYMDMILSREDHFQLSKLLWLAIKF